MELRIGKKTFNFFEVMAFPFIAMISAAHFLLLIFCISFSAFCLLYYVFILHFYVYLIDESMGEGLVLQKNQQFSCCSCLLAAGGSKSSLSILCTSLL